jgi:hypothetical protein
MRWRRARNALKWVSTVVAVLVGVCLLLPVRRSFAVYRVTPDAGGQFEHVVAAILSRDSVWIGTYDRSQPAPRTPYFEFHSWHHGQPWPMRLWTLKDGTPAPELSFPLLPLMLSIVPAAVLWWSDLRAYRQRRKHCCAHCGYDRRGLVFYVACPECGEFPGE